MLYLGRCLYQIDRYQELHQAYVHVSNLLQSVPAVEHFSRVSSSLAVTISKEEEGDEGEYAFIRALGYKVRMRHGSNKGEEDS